MRSISAFGVPALANKAYQLLESTPGTPISANVIVYNSTAANSLFMVKNATIAPGGALVPVGGDQKLVLEAGDYLQVNTSVASSVDVITSILEIT